MQVNLFDNNNPIENPIFNIYQDYKGIEYIRPPEVKFDGASLFTDELMLHPIVDQVKSKYKFGLFVEPKSIKPQAYMALLQYPQLVDKFDAIFTHDEDLLRTSPKFRLFPFLCGSYFLEEDHKIYDKTKNLSIVANSKTWAEGHRFRHEVIQAYGSRMDCYGPWYTDLLKDYVDEPTDTLRGKWLRGTGNILRAFKDYRYAMVIHSIRNKNYFDEKLLNCFFTGTVPIVWSPTNVGDFFDADGCHQFSSLEELGYILDKLGEEDYNSRTQAIKNNFETAHKYISFDKHIKDSITAWIEENN
jgi:hypothetical protein